MSTSINSQRKRSWIKTFLVYLLIFLLATVAGNIWLTRDQAQGQALDFLAEDLNGNPVSISFRDQTAPRVLYFFAEWCPICKMQHAVISSINASTPVLAVAMQSGSAEQVKNYVKKQGLKFRVVNDPSGQISQMYGVTGVPAVFILNGRGDISYSTRGYGTELGLLSRIWLSELENN